MEFTSALYHRRSVRLYNGEPISKYDLRHILSAGLAAPSSRGRRPLDFYVIRDRDTLQALSRAKAAGAAMLASCDCAIAVAGDMRKSDVWLEDASIAAGYMLLAAADCGVGACWVQLRKRTDAMGNASDELVREILNLHVQQQVAMLVALGTPQEMPPAHSQKELDWTRVHGLED
jgi:nitroreductase